MKLCENCHKPVENPSWKFCNRLICTKDRAKKRKFIRNKLKV